jgi:uncharacterized protein YbaP (TraB family)
MLCKSLFRAVLAASLAVASIGAPACANTTPAVGDDTPHKALLWRLSNGGSTVYLLGSFHLLRKDDYPLAPEIELAFEDAERVVFEVAPSEMTSAASVKNTRELASLGEGERLRELVPAPLVPKLEEQLAARGSSLSRMDRFEPWFVNVTLSVGISQSLGYRSEHGLDRYLMARATDARKPTVGLETVESQLRALKESPLEAQLATLKALVESPDAVRTAFDQLHHAWKNGDAEALNALTREKMKAASPESYRRVNTLRNEKWLPAIRDLLARPAGDDALVVVGSMHLVGEDGLVEMLQAHGYAAQRVGPDEADTRIALAAIPAAR